MSPAVKSTVAWNSRHPVGTRVIVVKDFGERVETTTRSEAFVCNAGYPVIFCNGIRGYYLLERVTPAAPLPPDEGARVLNLDRDVS